MPDIASVLKSEISRIARQQARRDMQALRQALSRDRDDIAALQRRMLALEGQSQRAGLRQPAMAAGKGGAGPDAVVRLRFSTSGLASARRRLGLSAVQMGALLGVSDQSVHKWEQGKARPRARQLPAIAAVRNMSRRQAVTALAALQA